MNKKEILAKVKELIQTKQYHMDEAISLRGKWDFLDSIQTTEKSFDPNIPYHANVLINSAVRLKDWNKITRQEWYKVHHNLREYYFQMEAGIHIEDI